MTIKRFGLRASAGLVLLLFSLAGCDVLSDLFHGDGMPNGKPEQEAPEEPETPEEPGEETEPNPDELDPVNE
ncbi:hypothetical protein FACS1894124_8830 [Spirochaetia bacterium]|nr:hypothetical protein FACS1894124_8830 [Spirochaetia bacterium]